MREHTNSGFSLVELLIALFIFSLLSAFSYLAINQLLRAQSALGKDERVLNDIQKAFLIIEKDLRQSVNAFTTDSSFSNQASSDLSKRQIYMPIESNAVENDSHGQLIINFFILSGKENTLSWVSYWLKDNRLYRYLNKKPSLTRSDFLTEMDDASRLLLLDSILDIQFSSIGNTNSQSQEQQTPFNHINMQIEHQILGLIQKIYYLNFRKKQLDSLNLASLTGLLRGAGSSSGGTQIGGQGSGDNTGEAPPINPDEEESTNSGEEESATPEEPPPPVDDCIDPFSGTAC